MVDPSCHFTKTGGSGKYGVFFKMNLVKPQIFQSFKKVERNLMKSATLVDFSATHLHQIIEITAG